MQHKKQSKKLPWYRRKLVWLAGGAAVFLVAILLAFRLSPWPGVAVIRVVFDHGSHQTLEALQAHQPEHPVTVLADQRYASDGRKSVLDVYIPEAAKHAKQPLPIIIWTHGGAWISGDKGDAAPYFKLLADQGFVVVSVNYELAPSRTYPAQIHQLNAAHAYITKHAAQYHANPDKIVLAGDSAGAQLSGQLAALIANPAYAKTVDIHPTLTAKQLAGVVLFCGIYKMEGLTTPNPTLPKIVSWGDDVTVWAYTGTRDKSSPLVRQMSPYYHVDKNFPPTFISGGNADPLTDPQSKVFADKLQSLHVDTATLFYPANHQPDLPHEYQFTLNADGERAFRQMVQFVHSKTK